MENPASCWAKAPRESIPISIVVKIFIFMVSIFILSFNKYPTAFFCIVVVDDIIISAVGHIFTVHVFACPDNVFVVVIDPFPDLTAPSVYNQDRVNREIVEYRDVPIIILAIAIGRETIEKFQFRYRKNLCFYICSAIVGNS